MKIPHVRQFESSDCGVACAVSICKFYGKDVTISRMREKMGTDSRGTTLKGLCDGLNDVGFETCPIYIERSSFELGDFTLPAIARIIFSNGMAHFVAIYRIANGKVTYMDPDKDKVQEKTIDEFYEDFDGQMIILAPSIEFNNDPEGENAGFLRTMYSILSPHKDLFGVALAASVVLTILGIVLSVFNKVLIDELIPYQESHQLIILGIALAIVTLTRVLLTAFRTHVVTYLSQRIDIPMTLGYFNHIFRLPLNFFASRKTGDIITRFQDSSTVKNVMTNTALTAVIDVFMVVIVGIVLAVINISLFGITAAIAVLSALLMYFFKGRYKKINRENMEQQSRLNSSLIESLAGIETIKANGCEEHTIEKIEKEFIRSLKIQFRSSKTSNIQNALSSSIYGFGNLAITIFGGLMVIDGHITLGTMMSFLSLSSYFIDPIQRIVGIQLSAQEAQISLRRLNEIYDMDEEEQDEEGKNEDVTEEEFKGIRMEGVEFRYGSRQLTLKGIDLEIKAGEKVAVVGRSGCGKTTLSKLLMKFYVPEKGAIYYNGVNLNEINAFALRDAIGYVPQSTQTFSGTIRDNLVLGLGNISQGKLDKVCEETACMEFITKQPAGYETELDASGGGLSGGEKQRLSIARAMLRDPKFMIFDEATSNMDFITERKTYELLFGRLSRVSALIIAHRLSTIRRCDRIYVIDGGRVAESGTHEELMQNDGLYREMWNNQVGEGIPGGEETPVEDAPAEEHAKTIEPKPVTEQDECEMTYD